MKKMKKMSTANDISQRNWDNKGRGGRHMDVVLMRHGESEANFENYWTGWLDVSLTEKGQEQARKAGEKSKRADRV